MFDLLTRINAPLIQGLPTKGIYTLIIFLSKETCLNVGKLGEQRFLMGRYTYTGSALGKGASSLKHRISRHIRKEKRNFWHIDFLLANENATVTTVVATQTNEKLECKLNSYIKTEGRAKILVKEFGASDCRENCGSHLLFHRELMEEPVLVQNIIRCYKALDLAPLHYPARSINAQHEIELLQKTRKNVAP